MTITISAEPVPLRLDEYGALRVGGTRVTLDILVAAFLEGLTPEEIVQQLPTLELADVYYALGYYLRHREEVNGYLSERERRASDLRSKIETSGDMTTIRERLLARKADLRGE